MKEKRCQDEFFDIVGGLGGLWAWNDRRAKAQRLFPDDFVHAAAAEAAEVQGDVGVAE